MKRSRTVFIAEGMEAFLDHSLNGIIINLYDDELEAWLEICDREGLEALVRPTCAVGD